MLSFFLFIEVADILLPISGSANIDALEAAVNTWISSPDMVTRGVVFSAKEVLKKLKRLGFREKSTEGSHVHLVSEERKGKVTVPIHGGEIRKGTLKSILNQAGIDLDTLVYA
jgi:predicted RNA binding protein YcfA (HicA-like mRNA interferase family)